MPIKLSFIDPSGNPVAGYFSRIHKLLAANFDIQLVASSEADFVFYSDFGVEHQYVKGIKIFFTGENHAPRWTDTDYAFTHEYGETERHMRFPYWAQILLPENEKVDQSLITRPLISLDELRAQKRKFANFVYRNRVCKKRNHILKELCKYKHVDSAGPWLNNMPNNWVLPKGWDQNQQFVSQYKFTISYENEAHLGYTTEKITHPLIGRSVPIYWGNPRVEEDFNAASFIHARNFPNEKALIKHIIEVDQDDELLLSYLNAPALLHQEQLKDMRTRFLAKMADIFNTARPQRSTWERTLYRIDRAIGRNADKRFKAWKRRKFPKKKA